MPAAALYGIRAISWHATTSELALHVFATQGRSAGVKQGLVATNAAVDACRLVAFPFARAACKSNFITHQRKELSIAAFTIYIDVIVHALFQTIRV